MSFTYRENELTTDSTYTFRIKQDKIIKAEYRPNNYNKVEIRAADDVKLESGYYKTGSTIQYDNSGYYAYLQFESDETDKKNVA